MTTGTEEARVPDNIAEEVAMAMKKGMTAEESEAIYKEYPLVLEDGNFDIKPPKLDNWLTRRAQGTGILKRPNKKEETLVTTNLKFMDVIYMRGRVRRNQGIVKR